MITPLIRTQRHWGLATLYIAEVRPFLTDSSLLPLSLTAGDNLSIGATSVLRTEKQTRVWGGAQMLTCNWILSVNGFYVDLMGSMAGGPLMTEFHFRLDFAFGDGVAHRADPCALLWAEEHHFFLSSWPRYKFRSSIGNCHVTSDPIHGRHDSLWPTASGIYHLWIGRRVAPLPTVHRTSSSMTRQPCKHTTRTPLIWTPEGAGCTEHYSGMTGIQGFNIMGSNTN